MPDLDYQDLVSGLPPNDRAILDELIRRRDALTASDLRPVTRSPKTGKPCEHGLTGELNRLQACGLVRKVASRPARYAAVSQEAVLEAAEVFRLKGQRTARRRRSARSRITELRVHEHGDYSEYYRVHRRVIELSEYVGHQIAKMAFWKAAPKDDLARAVTELGELRDAIDAALVCIKQRVDDDALLAKIDKLERTDGRPPAEAQTALALATKLRRQYDQRIGVLD